MTVARLRRDMSAQEFMRWTVYYNKKHQAEALEMAKARR